MSTVHGSSSSEQASSSLKVVLAMKSLRLRSSISSWAGSEPRGGRISVSPVSCRWLLKALLRVAPLVDYLCAAQELEF